MVLLIAMLLVNGCSNTKFLTGNEMLYTGREKIQIISEEKNNDLKPVEKIVNDVSFIQPNNALFDKRILPPVGLWYYYYQKPEEGNKGGFLYRKLKADPVLVTTVNPQQRSLKIESELFGNGYFNSKATYSLDTAKNNIRKAKISYSIEVEPPYLLNEILNQPAVDPIDTLINQFTGSLNLKTGDRFSIENISEEKQALASMLVDKGYYFFNAENIEIIADTTDFPYKVNLLIRKKTEIDEYILHKYTINKVEVHVYQFPDIENEAINNDSIFFDGVYISGNTDYLKSNTITRNILFREGDFYTEKKYQGTLELMYNYGVFQSARMLFAVSDSSKYKLDVLVELTPKNDVSLNLEGAVQSKSTGFAGPTSEITLAHANISKAANRLQLKVSGGFDWQWGKGNEDDLGSNSYNAGINTSFVLPQMLVPFKAVRENKNLIARSVASLGFEFINNVRYYQMKSINSSYGYQWHKNEKVTHYLLPLRINIVSLQKTTAEFDSIVSSNPYVKKSFEEQTIIGSKYLFSFDNSSKNRNGIFFQTEIGTSGNVIDLINLMGKNERPYKIFGAVYSQFVKTSIDFRYYNKTIKNGWVARLYAGTGFSYGNSGVMPYVEQYFSGGSSSLRGFLARSLGPGSYKPIAYNGIVDQTGDIKLEFNVEYRFPFSPLMQGALFLETGNVWLLNVDEKRPGAQFKFNTFSNQLAVGTGLGLRFDFDFFVLRTDFGLPLRYPYNDGDGNWNRFKEVFSQLKFNLAIGYPF